MLGVSQARGQGQERARCQVVYVGLSQQWSVTLPQPIPPDALKLTYSPCTPITYTLQMDGGGNRFSDLVILQPGKLSHETV